MKFSLGDLIATLLCLIHWKRGGSGIKTRGEGGVSKLVPSPKLGG